FLKGAKAHLKPEGRILLLISSLTGEKETIALCRKYGYTAAIAARKKIEWEEIVLLKIY
ncbi:MAG: methylase, partial [Candidatus Aenigmarchaeota archaeon]|nr:methylase [Candidatus Aenigmarchaeota archaeon]